MARTVLAVQDIPKNGSLADVTWTAADAANNHYFLNRGREALLVKNGHTSSLDVVVDSVPDEHGREGDETISTADGEISITDFFNSAIWNQSGADLGRVHIDVAVDTALSLAVVRFPNR